MPKGVTATIVCAVCGSQCPRVRRNQRTCQGERCVNRNRWRKEIMSAYWRRETEHCLVCEAWLGIGQRRRSLCGRAECRAEQKRRSAKANYVPHRLLPPERQEQRRRAALARYYRRRAAMEYQIKGAAA